MIIKAIFYLAKRRKYLFGSGHHEIFCLLQDDLMSHSASDNKLNMRSEASIYGAQQDLCFITAQSGRVKPVK